MPEITPRIISPPALQHLLERGYPHVLAMVYAARGITDSRQLDTALNALQPFDSLKNVHEMARLLADLIAAGKKILVVADYDADGATACAVAVRGLRAFGAQVDFIVPNRFEYGYGLTPEIVRLAAQSQPDVLLTVDNGIASVEGVAEANQLGMQVLVTDHHLPGDTLPDAACIVNPNQPGCAFPSKNLAGVGVMFYVLLALRAELRARGAFAGEKTPLSPSPSDLTTSHSTRLPKNGSQVAGYPASGRGEPNLATLLDLVALGTVADVVKLDQNNRILVRHGLRRIRAGNACAGISALLRVAGKKPEKVSSQDLGFVVGPRLNAAGRLDDMSLGIAALLSEDRTEAAQIAARLDALNRERRSIEADMQDAALMALADTDPAGKFSLALFDETWHQGVIGILASRLKERFHRPVIAFARAGDGELKGSGRSIAGLHLRDALDLVAKRHPGLIRKFGGHAAAAGLSIAEGDMETFADAFERQVSELLTEADLRQAIETDGSLENHEISLDLARLLEDDVWGQGFPAPAFNDIFTVEQQRIVGEKHLKLRLGMGGKAYDAILFHDTGPLPSRIHAAYSVDANEFNGITNVQLLVRHWQPEGQ